MKSTMLKLLAGMSLLSVTVAGAVASGVSSAGASPTSIIGGNPGAVASPASILDGWNQTVIFDANTPISGDGLLTSWTFDAANSGSIALVIAAPRSTWGTVGVGGSAPLVYVGPTESVTNTGKFTQFTYTLPGGVWVQQGDVVGFYYDGTNGSGIVPFSMNCTGCNPTNSGTGSFFQAGGGAYSTTLPSTPGPVIIAAQDNRTYAIAVSGVTGADCKDGGYATLGFSNQGACVSAFATHGFTPIGAPSE